MREEIQRNAKKRNEDEAVAMKEPYLRETCRIKSLLRWGSWENGY